MEDFLRQFLPIDSIFCIDNVEKDDSLQEAHIYLSVHQSATPPHARIHSHYERTWEHLRLFQYRTFIHCRLPIYQHTIDGTLSKPEICFSRDLSRFTLLYEAEVMRLMGIHYCLTAVARQLGISVQRVERIYHHHTNALTADSMESTPICVAYDETSTRKGHDYITTFYDMDAKAIVGIYQGRSADCVGQFMQDHPYPEALRHLSQDMSPAFISGAEAYFPKASITFDKWHVIKLMGKHAENLGQNGQKALEYLREIGPQGGLSGFYEEDGLETAASRLCFTADWIEDMDKGNALSKSINRHFKGICNYFESGITNGVMEGINSKIQTIKRIARGFRYVENFMKMIRFAFAQNQVASKII
jgi:transposase